MEAKICKIEGCGKEVTAKELCTAHYLRQRRHGSTDRPKYVREKLIEEGKSYCPRCNETKVLREFSTDVSTAFGIAPYCKKCVREKSNLGYKLHKDKYRNQKLKKKFGITLQDYNKMFERQESKCAICKKENKSRIPFGVDHDHSTKKIRGILCNQCNRGLGLFYDNTTYLAEAIEYLRGLTPLPPMIQS